VKNEDYVASNVDEDADEGAAAEAIVSNSFTVIDFIDNHQLEEIELKYNFTQYTTLLKALFKKILTSLKDSNQTAAAEAFQAKAQKFIKENIMPHKAKFETYFDQYKTPEDYEQDGQLLLVFHKDVGAEKDVPHMYVWKDGLEKQKF